jgi:murein DD-endopeptidase MepM/ murein hydrolase activator NlpD
MLFFQPVTAQDETPSGPVYIVQSGDTYYSIGLMFSVSVDNLIAANPNLNPNFLSVGAEVVIPGLEGVQGRLQTETVQLGESLRTLSVRNQLDELQLIRLNRITSPAEVYAGASLILPQQDDQLPLESRYLIRPEQPLLELAAVNNLNPWMLAEQNRLKQTWSLLPGEVLFAPQEEDAPRVSLLSPVVTDVIVEPLPLQQGETAVIRVKTDQQVQLTGSLAGRTLHFFPNGEGEFVALQGVHVMSDQGIYPLALQGELADGSTFSFEQMLIMRALGYINERIDGVDPATMDPTVTQPEEDQVRAVFAPVTPEKHWNGPFLSPGYDPNWITSTFGNRRSYNGGPYSFYHTGLDYGGGTGLPIKSPAPGIVVFAAPLSVRGNATIIDHGWGVYSGFWHQSEMHVQVGDRVETGQIIGLVGGTGRITGPHLHWEVMVNGVHVNPLTWLNRSYP